MKNLTIISFLVLIFGLISCRLDNSADSTKLPFKPRNELLKDGILSYAVDLMDNGSGNLILRYSIQIDSKTNTAEPYLCKYWMSIAFFDEFGNYLNTLTPIGCMLPAAPDADSFVAAGCCSDAMKIEEWFIEKAQDGIIIMDAKQNPFRKYKVNNGQKIFAKIIYHYQPYLVELMDKRELLKIGPSNKKYIFKNNLESPQFKIF